MAANYCRMMEDSCLLGLVSFWWTMLLNCELTPRTLPCHLLSAMRCWAHDEEQFSEVPKCVSNLYRVFDWQICFGREQQLLLFHVPWSMLGCWMTRVDAEHQRI